MAKKIKKEKEISESFLKERKMKILGCIIESYIEAAEPVGSQNICKKYHFKYSPATIRNIMAELEKEGLIAQPHTSAGRIPTDKGYRYFVDFIMKPYPLAPQEKAHIQTKLTGPIGSFESLMQKTLEVVSELTDELTVGITPDIKESVFKHIEITPLSSHKLLSTMLTEEGMIKNSILDLDSDFNEKELERINNFLNQTLPGQSVNEIVEYINHRILEAQDAFYYMFKSAMEIFQSISALEEPHVAFTGLENLFGQPEFSDSKQARELMKFLEGKNAFVEVVASHAGKECKVLFSIGKENKQKNLYPYTIASSSYKMGGKNSATVGVIGPTRMSYPRVSAVLEYTCNEIGKFLERELSR